MLLPVCENRLRVLVGEGQTRLQVGSRGGIYVHLGGRLGLRGASASGREVLGQILNNLSEIIFRSLGASLDHVQHQLGPPVLGIAAANYNLRSVTATAGTHQNIFAGTIGKFLILRGTTREGNNQQSDKRKERSNSKHEILRGKRASEARSQCHYDIPFEDFETLQLPRLAGDLKPMRIIPHCFFAICLLCTAGCTALVAADWPTDGGSPRRTAWQQDETVLTPTSVKDMKLIWKLKFDNQPREMHSLFPPLIADHVRTTAGEKQIAVVAGVSDNLYAVDVEAGTVLWQKHFTFTSNKPLGGHPGTLCPGGLTATPVLGPQNASGSRTIYVVSWDGMLHQLNMADGEEVASPRDFLPANGKPYALNITDNYLYTTTAQGCGGTPNKVYAIDISSPDGKINSFSPGGNGGLWGRTGAAIGSDGTIYAPTGDGPFDPEKHLLSEAIIAVAPKTVELKDYYSPPNSAFLWKRDLDMNVTPAVFDFKGRELLTSSSKECRVFLMDSKSLGGADHRTALDRTPLMCNQEVNFAAAGVWGSMASWEDKDGTRWVIVPFWGPVHPDFKPPLSNGAVTNGAIVAFKVEEKNGKPSLTPAWISRDMNQAEAPLVANGVVYAYGSGESNIQATAAEGLAANNSPNRVRNSGHAIIYALDARTGKELWSSGNQIASFAHFTGLSVANGRVYLGTYDSILYSFGLSK